MSEHYTSSNIETIDIIEDFIASIEKRDITKKQAYNITQALKYLLRCGLKDDSSKDLFKAENYIHRARTGEWIE